MNESPIEQLNIIQKSLDSIDRLFADSQTAEAQAAIEKLQYYSDEELNDADQAWVSARLDDVLKKYYGAAIVPVIKNEKPITISNTSEISFDSAKTGLSSAKATTSPVYAIARKKRKEKQR